MESKHHIVIPKAQEGPAEVTQERLSFLIVSGLKWVALSALPPQGQQTYRLILSSGPFPYPRDGVAFQNREGVLPKRAEAQGPK